MNARNKERLKLAPVLAGAGLALYVLAATDIERQRAEERAEAQASSAASPDQFAKEFRILSDHTWERATHNCEISNHMAVGDLTVKSCITIFDDVDEPRIASFVEVTNSSDASNGINSVEVTTIIDPPGDDRVCTPAVYLAGDYSACQRHALRSFTAQGDRLQAKEVIFKQDGTEDFYVVHDTMSVGTMTLGLAELQAVYDGTNLALTGRA